LPGDRVVGASRLVLWDALKRAQSLRNGGTTTTRQDRMGRWEELQRRNSLSNFENRNCPLDVVQENGWGHEY
jgi:hypothetical protein